MTDVELSDAVVADPDIVRLAALLRQELEVRYGVDVSSPAPAPHSPAVIARLNDTAVGCVVLELHPDHHAELRSMYVIASHRGNGLSHRLLSTIEETAQRRAVRTVRLTTGMLQPEAMTLYQRSGYRPTPNDPETRHFQKTLAHPAAKD